MYQRLIICVLLLSGGLSVKGQLFDSISVVLKEPAKLTFRLDGRGSFIANKPVRMLGIKMGLDHAGRFQYGVGYNFLRSKFEKDRSIAIDGVEQLVNTRLHLGMFTPWVDYAFYRRGPWQVSIPVQLGFGSGHLSYENANGERIKYDRSFIVVYEPAMTVQYRFWRYFGLAGGLGYRAVFKRKGSLGEQLTAPIYLLGVKVFFADLLKDTNLIDE